MRKHLTICLCLGLFACSEGPKGIAPAAPADTTVKMDFFAKPLPEIPLPNDIATRFDPDSATGRRINASMVAPTGFERTTRQKIDDLDGWGLLMPITIPFSGPLDPMSIVAGHREDDYDPSNDVVYLIDVDPDSPEFGQLRHLDLGNGNYPVVLENGDYWKNDPRGWTLSLAFEEADEDLDGDGVLDPGEDTDADGVLDRPNYLPGLSPARDDLAGRADALMTFYERETNTLIARPLVPLNSRTTYAVVVTRRLLDADGEPVGSPFPFVHHAAQTKALEPLPDVLPEGVALEDVAFAFTFTTQTVEEEWVALRDGLYGHGVQAHLSTEFPADVGGLLDLRDLSNERFEGAANAKIISAEDWIETMEVVYAEQLDQDLDSVQFASLRESQSYIDYYVVGWFESPQLFEREDEDGAWLGYNEQVWPADLHRVPAKARSERVYFWLSVPRPEVSARGEGRPADLAILSHGYSSNRFELAQFGGYFAQHGLATVAIDCVSHGISIHPFTKALIEGLVSDDGLAPFVGAAFSDRAHDQNGDEQTDSGADFWTSYMFHTRDVVRQSALDYLQLVRVFRSFDGDRRAGYDLDGDGEPELAGDFDGDGTVDVGGEGTRFGMVGASLGGIMSSVVGGVEPRVDVIVPIAGGGGLSDIGMRSRQGGVREAVMLRLLAPLYVGTLDEDGEMRVETIVPDLNDDATYALADVDGVEPGDTMVVENLANGERGCGYVSPEGTVRAAVESDRGDATRISFYDGEALVLGSEHCEVEAGAEPFRVIDTFERAVEHQAVEHAEGSPLVSLEDGMGQRRASPSLRRFMGFAQLALDRADPAIYARHLADAPLTFPGTGEQTGTHALIVTTMGDMNVPASSGVTVGRAAGLIPYLEPDPRFGKPANQVLIDTYAAEAVNGIPRYTTPDGRPVHIDVENFSQGTDLWGETVPRLEQPLHLGLDHEDPLGGVSGAIFPYAVPEGQHGFAFPGEMTDWVQAQCRADCTEMGGEDPCGCSEARGFDVGYFMFNMLGRYLSSGGQDLSTDLCNSRGDCPGMMAPLDPRPREARP